ncbi:MAG: hypothetical protein SFY92_07545 [Verrucomicrobiae bacterium]|nr:hypothetical protein [Verrucomicrobiae bacterium]
MMHNNHDSKRKIKQISLVGTALGFVLMAASITLIIATMSLTGTETFMLVGAYLGTALFTVSGAIASMAWKKEVDSLIESSNRSLLNFLSFSRTKSRLSAEESGKKDVETQVLASY